MSIYLAYQSSLGYFKRTSALRKPVSVSSLGDCECSLHALMQRESALGSLGCDTAPLQVIVDDRGKVRASDWCSCRLWSHPIPPGSFVSPIRGIYVSTPEFCFLQLASCLSRIELIRLGYEMCATYRLDPREEKGFSECSALTSKERLLDYLDGTGDTLATHKAEEALAWVVNGSASPRETITSMLVSLPTEMGGREVGLPALNWELMMGEGRDAKCRRIDLYWPESRFGLEYDSDEEHSGPDELSRDSVREKEIELQGVRLARVTNAELKTEQGRELLHKTICKGLGRKYVAPSARGRYVRRRLATLLLAPHHTML